jgi:cobyrinic acid a,c-diamide synthase
MSVPRLVLIPTHRTGVANAIAAAVAEIVTAQGREVRYHHVGPLTPASAWDRWEGAVFVDPALTSDEALVGLYDVAVRHADLSLLSSSAGLLDRAAGTVWCPADVAGLLDCPVVVVMDCRGWGEGIKILTAGIRSLVRSSNLAGVILSGVADRQHYDVLKKVLAEDDLRVAGCLFSGQGLDWDSPAPGPWGLPLSTDLVSAVARQVDVAGLSVLAGERGFLAAHNRLSDRGSEGPVVMVAGGEGFTPWSRDSVEVLRSAGAQVRRLDLLEEAPLPMDACGLVLAGTLWPETIPDIAINTVLLGDIEAKVRQGLPTLALGGGMLLLLARLQDTLGRTSDLASVVPAQAEILWDLEDPAYVEVSCLRDNVLLVKGENVMGWVCSEVEVNGADQTWDPPLVLRGVGSIKERREAFGGGSLLCSPAMIHLAATRGAASRFVDRCRAYAAGDRQPVAGSRAPGQ